MLNSGNDIDLNSEKSAFKDIQFFMKNIARQDLYFVSQKEGSLHITYFKESSEKNEKGDNLYHAHQLILNKTKEKDLRSLVESFKTKKIDKESLKDFDFRIKFFDRLSNFVKSVKDISLNPIKVSPFGIMLCEEQRQSFVHYASSDLEKLNVETLKNFAKTYSVLKHNESQTDYSSEESSLKSQEYSSEGVRQRALVFHDRALLLEAHLKEQIPCSKDFSHEFDISDFRVSSPEGIKKLFVETPIVSKDLEVLKVKKEKSVKKNKIKR